LGREVFDGSGEALGVKGNESKDQRVTDRADSSPERGGFFFRVKCQIAKVKKDWCKMCKRQSELVRTLWLGPMLADRDLVWGLRQRPCTNYNTNSLDTRLILATPNK
jgi:hypothetical protein